MGLLLQKKRPEGFEEKDGWVVFFFYFGFPKDDDYKKKNGTQGILDVC